MVTRTARSAWIAFAALCLAALPINAHAQHSKSEDKAAAWYFVGDTDRSDDAADAYEDALRGQQPRYEFSFTFSDRGDEDQLRFTSGQSLNIDGEGEVYTFLEASA